MIVLRSMLLIACMITGFAHAQTPLYIHTPPGGSSSASSQFLADGLNARGYNIEFRALNNCGLAKSTWDNAKGPVISFRDDLINNNTLPQCEIKTTQENLILYANTSPSYFCNNGSNGKTLEDFIRPGSKWIVGSGINLPDYALFDQISKDTGNQVKIVQADLIGPIAAAAKAGEIDFVIANGPWPEQQLGSRCFFVTGPYKVPGYVNATDLWPKNEIVTLTYGYWFIAKGFTPSEMTKLRNDAREIWQSKEWSDMRKKRGWNDSFVDLPTDKAYEILEAHREIWTKYRR